MLSSGDDITECVQCSHEVCYVHCKNIRISTNILWRVLHILAYFNLFFFYFNGTGSVCTSVSVHRRNNEAQAHIAMWACAGYSVDLRLQMDTEPVPLNMENSPQ